MHIYIYIYIFIYLYTHIGFPSGKKNFPVNARDARDMGSIPDSGRSPGIRSGNPLQHSCLENSMDRGIKRAIVCGADKRVRHNLATDHAHIFKLKVKKIQ